jgi:molybdopterin-guanine dinucleotide biosynthesis protein A
MLGRTIGRIAGLTGEIVVAGPDLPPELGPSDDLRLVRDRLPFAGPLVALSGALASARGALAIVVAGDMPSVVPEVLQSMLDRLGADPSIEGVILEGPGATGGGGHRQVLPIALRIAAARPMAVTAVEAGERSLRVLVDRLAAHELPLASWLPLDPEGRTLLDVDTPSDLERVRSGNPGRGRANELR